MAATILVEMISTIDIPYDFVDILYLKTDTNNLPRMLVGVKICADRGLLLELNQGTTTCWHYLIEVTDIKPFL